jgi:hypothetical protein
VDSHPAALLRYRFGSFEHMLNHLHIMEGRTLFFLRETRAQLAGGSRVVVEFSFGSAGQATTVRGSVLARIDGESGQHGEWIEFPDARLARRLEQGQAALTGRAQRRLACDMLVEVKAGEAARLGRMIDVSLHGVRIVGVVGLSRGDEVQVRIMGAEAPLPAVLGRVQVVRSDPGGDIAVKFVRSDVTARVASSKLYSAVEESWRKARELMHPALCCVGGALQEPPVPHMKSHV